MQANQRPSVDDLMKYLVDNGGCVMVGDDGVFDVLEELGLATVCARGGGYGADALVEITNKGRWKMGLPPAPPKPPSLATRIIRRIIGA